MSVKQLSLMTNRWSLLDQSEEKLQAAIVEWLIGQGYEVLVTSRRRKKARCPRCLAWFWPFGGDGCDKGIPDLLVSRDDYPEGVWLGLEIKTRKGRLSIEQEALRRRRRIYVVRSTEEALDVLKGYETDHVAA